MIQAPENYALVTIDKKFQDENGGLIIDTTWFPEEFATLEGVVVTAPVRTVSDLHRKITGSVKEGDRIVFSYGIVFSYENQPDNDTPVYKNLVIYEGKEYWKVEAAEIFCKIENGNVVMVTDNVLIEPYYPPQETYDDLVLRQANNMETGYVLGMPEKSTVSCKAGDLVCFEKRFVQEYIIFGKPLYIIPSRRVLAKQEQ